MRKIKVGVAYEGGNDGDVLLVWLRRLLLERGFAIQDSPEKLPSGTSILGFIPSYIRRFERDGVDLALFCTDQDKDPDSRRRKIVAAIQAKSPAFASRSIVAVPSPHIEKWLLLQDSVVKNILHLDGSKPLPHKSETPKTCFLSLYGEADGYSKSQQQLRLEIAEQMDIDHCARIDSGFGHFVQDARNIINSL